jgi:WD40 repeat protein
LECFQTQTRLELNDIEHLELGHLNPGISSLAFSPIDQVLAAGYWDQTVQLWDLDKTQEYPIVVLRGHEHGLSTVAFSLDGRLLASGSYDKTICIWIAQAENLAEMVCERVWRNLSMKEWQRALGEDIPYERTCGRWPSGAGVLWDAPDIR